MPIFCAFFTIITINSFIYQLIFCMQFILLTIMIRQIIIMIRSWIVYINKVELTGVNTATIKVLKEKEKMELLKKYREGDKQAKDDLINGNLKLVLSVVQKFTNRGENLDDIFQVGCMGLIKAIHNFDMSLGVRFSTYCVPMIIGEIRRYLRDNNSIHVSRSLRDIAYRAMHTKEMLTNLHSKEPTIEQIANEMGMKKSSVVLALEAISNPVSLNEPIYSDGGDTIYVMDQIGDSCDDKSWLNEMMIKDAIHALDEREKKILNLRFLVGKTQTEVANEIGISQAQVSRLEKGVLNKVKCHL